MKSTPWAAIAAMAWAAATTNASRRSTRCSWRWTASTRRKASSSSPRPTAPTCSTPRCCARAVSTARSPSTCPTCKGREEILRVHSKRVKLAEDVDMAVIARGTPGYSGAELANVINEAALLAARRGLKAITLTELEEARDKVRWGRERRSMAMSQKEKENTAYHEAGHAILFVLLEHTDPLHKVTIIPRGPALGLAMSLPEGDRYTKRKNELIDDITVAMGGRVAEEIIFGDVTTGASGDIRGATHFARRMVCEWGMCEKMGMVEYGEHEDYVFLGRDISRTRDYSEATAQEIDREVRKLCDDAYARAMEVLTKNRDKLEAIAKALLEFETLDGAQIRTSSSMAR